MKFEEALEKLTKIKDKLESSSISLDESIELYKQSVEYTKTCLEILKETEGRIVTIKSEIDGLVEKPLNISEE